MKYRRLPIEDRLAALPEEERSQVVAAEFLATARTAGFQLVTGALRGLEEGVLTAMKEGGDPARLPYQAGALQAIESIRRTLTSFLPETQRPTIDWADDADEEWNTLPESSLLARADEDSA